MAVEPGALVTPNVRLVSLLGEGGMGSVWVADHLSLETQVAVKFMAAELLDAPGLAARFKQEATLAAKIDSLHVVKTFDHGVMDGTTPYIVMELLKGSPLDAWLQVAGRLGLREVRLLVTQMCSVLRRAHDLGIVHRDIKPSNIFLVDSDYDLFVKVLDFGVAKSIRVREGRAFSTTTGAMVGTVEYMSPEQITEAKEVDGRADLWALAVVAYEALTGELPFFDFAYFKMLSKTVEGRFTPPSRLADAVPPAIDDWFARAFRPLPADRFPDASAFADAFAAAVDGQPAPSPRERGSSRKLASLASDAFDEDSETQHFGQLRADRSGPLTAQDLAREGEAAATRPTTPASTTRQRDDGARTTTPATATTSHEETSRTLPIATVTKDRSLVPLVDLGDEAGETKTVPQRASSTTAGAIAGTRAEPRPGVRGAMLAGAVATVAALGLWAASRGEEAPAEAPASAKPSASDPAPVEPTASVTASAPPSPPPGMLAVPAGEHRIGCAAGGRDCFDDEKPAHTVTLGRFAVMRTEVTVGDYRQCVDAGKCQPPRALADCTWTKGEPRLPTTCVTWSDADAYCQAQGWRLPTEQEWEVAARGKDMPDYPWGSSDPSCERMVMASTRGGCGTGAPHRVGTTAADKSWVGALDLGGNVREWTASDYGPYPGGKAEPVQGKVNRGASWLVKQGEVSTSHTRVVDPPDTARADIGFRCVVDL